MPDENQTEVETMDTNPEVEAETAPDSVAPESEVDAPAPVTGTPAPTKEIDTTPVPGLEDIIVAAIKRAFPDNSPVAAVAGTPNYHNVSVEKLENGYVVNTSGKSSFFHGLDELLVHAESSFRKAFTK